MFNIFTSSTTAVESNIESVDLETTKLLEPLLKNETSNETIEVCGKMAQTNSSCSESNILTLPLKVLSLVSGSLCALFSQVLLWEFLWQDSVLHAKIIELITFSLTWSFWTCVIVFATMLALIQSFRILYISKRTSKNGTISCNNIDLHVDDLVFLMEAHFVVGALASISLSWLINNCFQSNAKIFEKLLQLHPIVTVVMAVFAFGLFVRWIVLKGSNDTNGRNVHEIACDTRGKYDTLSSTFQMVAATLGSIVGISSQFTLSVLLWSEGMSRPLIESPILFSLLWSLATVALTHLGCVSLRLLVSSSHLGQDLQTTNELLQKNKLLLRMEAAYVFFCLLGICSAWVGIDVLTGMTEQIMPSICMLAASLVAFSVILYCFPEEICKENRDEEPIFESV